MASIVRNGHKLANAEIEDMYLLRPVGGTCPCRNHKMDDGTPRCVSLSKTFGRRRR